MTEIPDILTFRARRIAVDLLTAYQRQRDAMRIAGIPSSELAAGDGGETVVADVAACMAVAARLPSAVGLNPAVLERMRTAEETAFKVLRRAAEAYFASEDLRRDLGRPAVEPFRLLRMTMNAAA